MNAPAESSDAPPETNGMGWLERKWLSGGVRRCWERRWCAVHGGFLFFHAEQQAVPKAGAECDASAGSDGLDTGAIPSRE